MNRQLVVGEFAQPLPASAAWWGQSIIVTHDNGLNDLPFPVGDQSVDRGRLSAPAKRAGGILDIAAGVKPISGPAHDGGNGKAGIGAQARSSIDRAN